MQEQQRQFDQQRLQEQRRPPPHPHPPGDRIDVRAPGGGGEQRDIHMRREPRDARDR